MKIKQPMRLIITKTNKTIKNIKKIRIMNSKYYITILFLLVTTNFAFSQIDKQVNVVKEYTPIISDAYRISTLPRIKDTTKAPKHTFSYNIESQPFNVKFKLKPINSAKMVGEPLKKLYSTNIRLGFGNYLTPYLELNYNTLRSKGQLVAVNLKHISSYGKIKMNDGEKVYAGFSNTQAKLYGKKILKHQKFVAGSMFIKNITYGYYGYDDNDTTLNSSDKKLNKNEIEKQDLKIIGVSAKIKSINRSKSKLNYDLNLKNIFLQETSKIYSNNLDFYGNLNNYYKKEIIGVDYGINYINTNTKTDTINNTIIRIKPYLNKTTDTWRIIAGLDFNADVNPSTDPRFHFYPMVDIKYNVFDEALIPYLGVFGTIENNNYQKIIFENPYILNDLNVKNTDNVLSLYLGVKGKLSSNFSYNFKTTYKVYEDMYFYINHPVVEPDSVFPLTTSFTNKFDVVYDNVSLIDLYGELNWEKSKKLSFLLFGHYYEYSMGNLAYAWHKPQYNLTFSTKYNMQNKIVTNLDVFAIGKQYAVKSIEYKTKTKKVYSAKELDGFIDVNLSFEYRYTKILSVFLKFNNILSQKYYRYNYYPTQGFNVLAGFSYSL